MAAWRAMSKKSISAIDAEVSEEIRRGLVNSLFADSRSLVSGSVLSVTCGVICAYIAHSWIAWLIGAAMFVVTAIRLRLLQMHHNYVRQHGMIEALRYERAYVFGATAYLLCNGALVLWALEATDDRFLLLLTFFVALLNALSIALRNFAIQYGVVPQIAAVTIPFAIGLASRGGWFLVLAFLMGPTSLFIYSSAARLRNILLSEMAYRRQSDLIAEQFDFAINNMSHGMCMISSDMKILVSNGKFAQFLGLPATRGIENANFKTLLRLGTRTGALSQENGFRVLNAFATSYATEGETNLQIENSTGSVCELTLRHNSKGGWVVVVQDVTEKRQAERVIYRMAHFDAVTNLQNRPSFEIALTEALAAARTTGDRTEVLFLDLDGFKQVNDTLGHKIGDRVLVGAGARLSDIAGPKDLIARWGGDEFVILRRSVQAGVEVETFADQIIAELSRPSLIEGSEIAVGASIGIAVAIGGDSTSDLVLQQADMALYEAKRGGRGRYRVYEEAMSASALARRLLELDLHTALASGAFELHYQPIVNLETQAIVSFEALARWKHPMRGQVSPALFVPILEDLNLMTAFGGWALQRACNDAAKWPRNVRVGVNVSTKQLESDNLYDAVVRALQNSGLAPHRLELEITETALLGGNDVVEKTLARVRALGVKIALDDFGTGYSSLSHLMRLPLDKVKIDQTFTQKLGKDRKARVLIENIARLSSQLGMVVTVEGIETREQLDQVRSIDAIEEGQGYLFSKPLSLEAVELLFPPGARREVA
jgi:diguanylate cyclase (GGDEF)-like protein